MATLRDGCIDLVQRLATAVTYWPEARSSRMHADVACESRRNDTGCKQCGSHSDQEMRI